MENIIFGVVTGCVLLLGAVGFSMVQKAEGFINITHGQFIMLGAYLTLFLNVSLKLNFLLAAIVSIVITSLIGVFLARAFFAPIRRQGGMVLLFTSIGLAYAIYGIVAAIAGTRIHSFNVPTPTAIRIAGQPIVTIHELAIILIAIGAAVSLHLFFLKTKLGKMIRAMADNTILAGLRGINTDRVSIYIWLVASALAALSGILLGLIGSVSVEMGWSQILMILAATVLGGMGSIYGVMIGALLLGLGMDLSVLFLPPYYRTAVAFVIIIVVLLIRPEGLQGIAFSVRGYHGKEVQEQ